VSEADKFEIPAKNEITALVPDKNLLRTIMKYPHFLNHIRGLLSVFLLMNGSLFDSTILFPKSLPSQ